MPAMGTGRRLTPRQAADQLGVSVEAVRGRIKRGTIAHERDGNRGFVILDAGSRRGVDDVQDVGVDPNSTALISQLRDEVEHLREESRRKDEIIMQQAVTMRARGSPAPEEGVDHGQQEEEPPEDTEGSRRPWWRFWR